MVYTACDMCTHLQSVFHNCLFVSCSETARIFASLHTRFFSILVTSWRGVLLFCLQEMSVYKAEDLYRMLLFQLHDAEAIACVFSRVSENPFLFPSSSVNAAGPRIWVLVFAVDTGT